MTFLELAEKVLLEIKKPLSASEIWKLAEEKGYTNLLGSQGKTPAATLGALLHVSARDNKRSPFSTLGSRPKKFLLKSIEYSKDDLIVEDSEVKTNEATEKLLEKDLHAVLSYFIFYHMDGFSKTLNHTKSNKKQYGEWVHPDIVACSYAIGEWEPEVFDLSMTVNDAAFTLMSFEIKRHLSFGNLRESFFQAVSNSSWAHEGYLVTSSISEEREFLKELSRLSLAFGIGVILLNLEDIDDSEILLQAEEKEQLDWNTINKLTINPDFKEFLTRVKKDLESREIRKEWYDKVDAKEVLMERINKKLR